MTPVTCANPAPTYSGRAADPSRSDRNGGDPVPRAWVCTVGKPSQACRVPELRGMKHALVSVTWEEGKVAQMGAQRRDNGMYMDDKRGRGLGKNLD